MKQFLVVAVLLALALTQAQGGKKKGNARYGGISLSDEARLYKYLTEKYDVWNPDRVILPVVNTSETLHVNLGLALIRLEHFDEETSTATLNTWQRHLWKDFSLVWNPADFGGINYIRIPISKIWQPDIVLYNGFDADALVEEALAVVTSDGSVLYIPRMNRKIHCSAYDDKLDCRLKFGSWTFDGFRFNMDFYDNLEEVDLSDYIDGNNKYRLVDAPAKKNVKYYPCCEEPYPDLTFSLNFEKISNDWWGN